MNYQEEINFNRYFDFKDFFYIVSKNLNKFFEKLFECLSKRIHLIDDEFDAKDRSYFITNDSIETIINQKYQKLKSLIIDQFYVKDTSDYLYDSMVEASESIRNKFWRDIDKQKTQDVKDNKLHSDVFPSYLNYRNGKWLNNQYNYVKNGVSITSKEKKLEERNKTREYCNELYKNILEKDNEKPKFLLMTEGNLNQEEHKPYEFQPVRTMEMRRIINHYTLSREISKDDIYSQLENQSIDTNEYNDYTNRYKSDIYNNYHKYSKKLAKDQFDIVKQLNQSRLDEYRLDNKKKNVKDLLNRTTNNFNKARRIDTINMRYK